MAAKQITIWVRNRPGTLAKITSALAGKGVNITGLFASDAKGRSAVRLLVSNAARAKAALKRAGFQATDEPAVVLNLADKAGQLARVAGKLARARVNISYGYATVSPAAKRAHIVLGVRNAAAARRALR
jgi:hypothetical protein